MKASTKYIFTVLVSGVIGFSTSSWLSLTNNTPALRDDSILVSENLAQILKPQPSALPPPKFKDIDEQEEIFEQLRLTYEIASRSNFEQLSRYLESVINDTDPLYSNSIAGILLEKMIVVDAGRALLFVETHQSMNQYYFISHILTSWIRHDPEPALQRVISIANQHDKVQLMSMIITMQAQIGPERAFELLELYAPDDQSLERQLLTILSNHNPELARESPCGA